jgi:hypothetical protein
MRMLMFPRLIAALATFSLTAVQLSHAQGTSSSPGARLVSRDTNYRIQSVPPKEGPYMVVAPGAYLKMDNLGIKKKVIRGLENPVSFQPPVQQTSCPPFNHTPEVAVAALDGTFLDDGGRLAISPFPSASINARGETAFVAQVRGSARNQGVFVANRAGVVREVVRGCGGRGGSGDLSGDCGDPSPIGGTFAGLFSDATFSPQINDHGDVVFLADVLHKGAIVRGLFLRDAETGQIIKVAATGDPIDGGIVRSVTNGVINSKRTVAFRIKLDDDSGEWERVVSWNAGHFTSIARSGQPIGNGKTIRVISFLSRVFSDGTEIAVYPTLGINDAGQIAFNAEIQTGEEASRGILLFTRKFQNFEVAALEGDPVANEEYLADVFAPVLNERGEVAFSSYTLNEEGEFHGRVFAGRRGALTTHVSFGDPVEGGVVRVKSLTGYTSNFNDCGQLLSWVEPYYSDSDSGRDVFVVTDRSGNRSTVYAGPLRPFDEPPATVSLWPGLSNGPLGVLGLRLEVEPGTFSRGFFLASGEY